MNGSAAAMFLLFCWIENVRTVCLSEKMMFVIRACCSRLNGAQVSAAGSSCLLHGQLCTLPAVDVD